MFYEIFNLNKWYEKWHENVYEIEYLMTLYTFYFWTSFRYFTEALGFGLRIYP